MMRLQQSKQSRQPQRSIAGRLRNGLRSAVLVVIAVTFCLAVIEAVFRTFPAVLPSGAYYGSGAYQADLGLFLPHTPIIYNKARYLIRTPNQEGFQDIEHAIQKPPHVLRVGFFGDSYVEAIQVPLASTFFRRIPQSIAGKTVETFGFGLSGIGTLHASLFYQQYGPRYDLDVVVYPFVSNDPSDHSSVIQSKRRGFFPLRPLASLTSEGAGYVVEWPPGPQGLSLGRRSAMFAKTYSLVVRVMYARFQLLLTQGKRPIGRGFRGPDKTPPHASLLTRRILAEWKDKVAENDQAFLVLYVPQQGEIVGSLSREDSWYPWLAATCAELGVALLDPTAALRSRQEAGEAVYDDHWSPAGHEVIADVLTQWLQDYMARLDKRGERKRELSQKHSLSREPCCQAATGRVVS